MGFPDKSNFLIEGEELVEREEKELKETAGRGGGRREKGIVERPQWERSRERGEEEGRREGGEEGGVESFSWMSSPVGRGGGRVRREEKENSLIILLSFFT